MDTGICCRVYHLSLARGRVIHNDTIVAPSLVHHAPVVRHRHLAVHKIHHLVAPFLVLHLHHHRAYRAVSMLHILRHLALLLGNAVRIVVDALHHAVIGRFRIGIVHHGLQTSRVASLPLLANILQRVTYNGIHIARILYAERLRRLGTLHVK